MGKWTVYIAEDQTLFRKGLARLVQSFEDVEKVSEASNGKEALSLFKNEVPDAILMDLEMPVMDGIEASQKILNKYPDVKVIVLSTHDSINTIFYLMELGVHAFLQKNAEPEEVEAAIASAIEKDFFHNELVINALRQGAIEARKQKVAKPIFQQAVTVTDREKEVLLLICEELTNKEIGSKLNLSEKTIQNHRARLIEKLGVKNTVGLVRYAYESGLIH